MNEHPESVTTLTVVGHHSGKTIQATITADVDGQSGILTIPDGLSGPDLLPVWGAVEQRGWTLAPVTESAWWVDGGREHHRLYRMGTAAAASFAHSPEVKTMDQLTPSRAILARSVGRSRN